MYEITRDGFTILVMGFTGKRAMEFKEKYIEAFNRMEDELRIIHSHNRNVETFVQNDATTKLQNENKLLENIEQKVNHIVNLFDLDKQNKLLYAQNECAKYHIETPTLKALEQTGIEYKYEKRGIYKLFGATGRGSKPKQDEIRAVLNNLKEEPFAKRFVYQRNGHTDVYYKYSDEALERVKAETQMCVG